MDIKQSGPEIPPIQFGKMDDSFLAAFILADIAKSSFVIARIQLRPDFFLLHLTYITFHLIHHSIEAYLKAFLKKIDGDYPHGHSLINLRNLIVKKTIPPSLGETLQSDEVSKFLATLDGAYIGGKYGEMVASGFDVDDLRKIYDVLMREFIVSFFSLVQPVAERVGCVELTEAQEPLFAYGNHGFDIYVWPSRKLPL